MRGSLTFFRQLQPMEGAILDAIEQGDHDKAAGLLKSLKDAK